MFELVLLLALLLVEVDEVVRDPVSASAVHVPADPERVTGDVTDLDLLRNRQVVRVHDGAVCRLGAWRRTWIRGFYSPMNKRPFSNIKTRQTTNLLKSVK